MIRTSDKIEKKRKKFLKDVNNLLDRSQLDRPFLLREKLKCIWNDIPASSLFEDFNRNRPYHTSEERVQLEPTPTEGLKNLRQILKERLKTRNRENIVQREGYNRLLQYIANRRTKFASFDIQAEEMKALTLLRIICDGGWVCDRPAIHEII